MIILLTLLIIVFALIGTPLFAVMGLSALVNHYRAEIDLQAVIINFYQLASKPLLQTLPIFAFAGYLLTYSGAPRRLLQLSKAFLGWVPGGLAIVTIVACSFLTALTGASGITIVALGGLLLPALMKDQYSERFSLGLITSGGSLGLLFAPSLPVILYGVISETSIDDLFRAGIMPGLMIIAFLSLYGMCYAVKNKIPRQRFSFRELIDSLWIAKWEVPLPFLVLGGIYSGTFAISEAAVIAAAYILIVEVIIYRDIRIGEIGRIARESVVLVGGILIILGMTLAVTSYLIDEEVPTRMLEYFSARMTSKYTFLIALNCFLLIVGCMIDIYAAIVLIVPLISPIAMEYGIHPVHLGIIFLTNLGIGYITPPVGLNLFIASIRFKKPVVSLYMASLSFLACLLVALVLITYVPQISLMLLPPGS